jgi:glycosyltransferase involved in cell wall biosynthesis
VGKIEVLYISYDGMTDPLGQSQVLPYLAGLSKLGYSFTLISCEKADRFQMLKNVIEEYCLTNNIKWIPIKYTKSPPVLSTIYDIYKIRHTVKQLTKTHQYQIVHCRSYIAALIGLELKKSGICKFVFDMRGFWADERVDGGIWSLKNPLYKLAYNFFKKKEKEFLEHADHVISLTHCAAEEIKTWKNISPQPPVTVIPCSADTKLFNSESVSIEDVFDLKKRLGIKENDFILSYIGSIGTWYMLEEMLDFFVVLKQQRINSKFLFITNDPSDDILYKAVSRGIEKSDIIITQSPRQKMPLYITLSNFTIFFIRPTYSKKASSPVKQGEAMCMGIPIVCNSGVGDTDMIVKDSNAGIVVEDMNHNSYERAVTNMFSINFDKSHIVEGAKKWYSLDSAITAYASVYDNVMKR